MRFIFLIITVVLSQVLFGQNLKEIFIKIPGLSLSQEERLQLIKNYTENKSTLGNGVGKNKSYLSAYEPNNGYLLFTGAYEGSTEIAFWNLQDGSKLIGVVVSSCGGACDNDVRFWKMVGTEFSEVKVNMIIPSIQYSDFMDVEKMKKEGIDIVEEKTLFQSKDLLVHLPSKGRNIIIESQYQDTEMDKSLKRFDLGNRLELIWNNGSFLKAKK